MLEAILLGHIVKKNLANTGLNITWVQHNKSFNAQANTLRGMHFQQTPYGEIKLVSCLQGAIYDVIIDNRPESSTYQQWHGVELSGENQKLLYVPKGFAHGYVTLTENTLVYYQVSEFYYA